MPIEWYYDNCKEFQEYVDRVAKSRHFSKVEVMQLVITKEYLKMLIAEGRVRNVKRDLSCFADIRMDDM